MVLGTVVEQRFHAAQTRSVVDDRLRRAETVVVADPLRRQLTRPLTLLAPTPVALRTRNRVQLITGAAEQPVAGDGVLRAQNAVLGTMTKLLVQCRSVLLAQRAAKRRLLGDRQQVGSRRLRRSIW